MNKQLKVKNLSLKRYNELLEKEKIADLETTYVYISRALINDYRGQTTPLRVSGKSEFRDVVKRFIKMKNNAFQNMENNHISLIKLKNLAERDIKKLKADLDKATCKKWWQL